MKKNYLLPILIFSVCCVMMFGTAVLVSSADMDKDMMMQNGQMMMDAGKTIIDNGKTMQEKGMKYEGEVMIQDGKMLVKHGKHLNKAGMAGKRMKPKQDKTEIKGFEGSDI
jgi:hypothetical protein